MGSLRSRPRPHRTFLLFIPALLALAVAASDTETLLPLRSFSLQPPFIDEQLGNRWWDFGGSTIIEVNTFVRLTPDVTSKSGWIFTKLPFTSSSWEVEFEFRVNGVGKAVVGDGFAFWYTKDRAEVGPVFGNKDKFDGLGVFFDTYANSRQRPSHPYVMAMVGDGNTTYNNLLDGVPNEIGGCPSDFRTKEWPTKAKIRYLKDSHLEVLLDVSGENAWEICFKKEGVKLPSVGYLGFSALTGDISDIHDILSVQTHGIVLNTTPGAPGASKPLNPTNMFRSKPGSSGRIGWVTIVLIIVGVAAVGGIAFMAIAGKKKSPKRF